MAVCGAYMALVSYNSRGSLPHASGVAAGSAALPTFSSTELYFPRFSGSLSLPFRALSAPLGADSACRVFRAQHQNPRGAPFPRLSYSGMVGGIS